MAVAFRTFFSHDGGNFAYLIISTFSGNDLMVSMRSFSGAICRDGRFREVY